MNRNEDAAIADESLQEGDERFRALTELAANHYWEQDAQFRFTRRVGAVWATGTVPDASFMGKARWEMPALNMSPADWARHRADLEAHREFRNLEIERPLPAGGSRWISTSGRPIFDADGRLRGYRGVGRDITEHKRAEEESRRFRLAMDHSADMILLVDRKSMRYVDANPTVTRLLGYSREEILSMGPQDMLPVGRAELEASYDELIARPENSNVLNSYYLCKDGSQLPMESSRRVLRSKDSWTIVAIARDIRERVAAERKVLQLNESLERRVVERTAELEAANRELESFSFSVSHDLRAPMRVICAFASLIRKDYAGALPAEAQRYFQRVEQNAVRMTQLIDDLLELSRTGRAALSRRRVDMRALVDEVAQEVLPKGGTPVRFTVGPLRAATGDAVLLRQVWHNLIGNAVKFSHKAAAPCIEIGSVEERGETAYCVRDNGAGFDMAYVEKLFGTFQRLHTPEEFEGTGVGLAIVKRIVERHGGRVWAESAPERGATFHFSLPSG